MPLPPQTLERLGRAKCPIPLNSPGGEIRAITWLADQERARTKKRLGTAVFLLAAIPVGIVSLAAGAAAGVVMGGYLVVLTGSELCRLLWKRFRALFRP